ncbi:SsgA family sporulation/cell division regulator [Actinacidiphila glaucinigra]|uniref:SsgA family sporulation/cell division regulator n=1 Tax=Actinacidiphila glaucinigra TaxID=235986 RepID=UPI00380BBB8A
MDKLTTRLPMRLLAGGETPIHLKVECHYSAADPFAVHINFGCVGGLHEAVWVASRELLLAGLKAPTGHGDLLIGPWDHAYSYMALTGDTGTALLHIRTRAHRFPCRHSTDRGSGSGKRPHRLGILDRRRAVRMSGGFIPNLRAAFPPQ